MVEEYGRLSAVEGVMGSQIYWRHPGFKLGMMMHSGRNLWGDPDVIELKVGKKS